MSNLKCVSSVPDSDSEYRSGPTTCMAHPDVVASIKSQLVERQVLSAADARLAQAAGFLSAEPFSNQIVGLNDGVIYPPDQPPSAPGQPSKAFALAPPTGPKALNCLVLLVDFSDNTGTQSPSHYQNLLFDPANPNSMHSFYKDLSYGSLNLTGTVTGWIRANHPYTHYTNGQSGMGMTYPRNTPGLLEEILTKYCGTGSLAPFDANGDGYVDGLFLVHAGIGAETDPSPTGRKDKIWSHKWVLPRVFTNSGVKAYAYFTAPEDGRLGVFSHEFGHFLGLPDLYDTTYRSSGVGSWCLMAGGSWNGGGNQPARMSAWCLSTLGWISPRNITAPQHETLKPLEFDKTACCRIGAGNASPNEYFLLENRQATGRDSMLPGSGLAVWHVDDNQSDNTNPWAYKVSLIQADGRRDLEFNRNQGDGGDLFPGSTAVTSVNDVNPGDPHLRSNRGTATRVSLSNIADTAGDIDVDISV